MHRGAGFKTRISCGPRSQRNCHVAERLGSEANQKVRLQRFAYSSFDQPFTRRFQAVIAGREPR
jgi:hypothetical protein